MARLPAIKSLGDQDQQAHPVGKLGMSSTEGKDFYQNHDTKVGPKTSYLAGP